MRNLLNYLLKYHFFILFILIETLSVYLVIQHNPYHNAKFYHLANNISGFFNTRFNRLGEYFHLKEINQELALENMRLRNQCKGALLKKGESRTLKEEYQFEYILAEVINNSVNKLHNHITIDKGINDGIKQEMGLISPDGVIGVTNHVSNNFSTAISLLNPKLKVSAKIKNNDYYGSVVWDGKKPRQALLKEIPYHVKINIGDTVITSGYSAIFPEGILIGHITNYNIKSGNFYDIQLKLAADFHQIKYVYIVQNPLKEEKDSLENLGFND